MAYRLSHIKLILVHMTADN